MRLSSGLGCRPSDGDCIVVIGRRVAPPASGVVNYGVLYDTFATSDYPVAFSNKAGILIIVGFSAEEYCVFTPQ